MRGPFLIAFYGLISAVAALAPGDAGAAAKAKWASRFSALSGGGLDDDFANEAYRLIRKRPHLLDGLQEPARPGFFAMRRKMAFDTIKSALAADLPDTLR